MSDIFKRTDLLKMDLNKLASSKNTGSLIFDEIGVRLTRIQNRFKASQGLLNVIPRDYSQTLKNCFNEFEKIVERLQSFDAGGATPPKSEKDWIDRQSIALDKKVFDVVALVLPLVTHEQIENSANPDEVKKSLQEVTELKEKVVNEFKTQISTELEKVQKDIESIRSETDQVRNARGVRASTNLNVHFEGEIAYYTKKSRFWLGAVIVGWGVVIWALCYFFAYTYTLISNDVSIFKDEGFLALSIFKLILIATIWYGVSFARKDYNINSQLLSVNRHRNAVAKTLSDFMTLNQNTDAEKVLEVVRSASEAMFKHAPIGYVSKTANENTNPVLQVVNELAGINKTH